MPDGGMDLPVGILKMRYEVSPIQYNPVTIKDEGGYLLAYLPGEYKCIDSDVEAYGLKRVSEWYQEPWSNSYYCRVEWAE